MRYFYISRNEIEKGDVLVYDTFDMEIPIEVYRTGAGKEDALQYIGDNIPGDLIYDEDNDSLFSESERPSPYHVFVKGIWIIKDKKAFKEYNKIKIEEVKKKILEYGFDYKGHRQRCRDKDIALMVASVTTLQVIGKDKTITWYFEDNFGMELDLKGMTNLMLNGTTFIQSVYDTESYFKNLDTEEIITDVEFENKRKEIHKNLVGA